MLLTIAMLLLCVLGFAIAPPEGDGDAGGGAGSGSGGEGGAGQGGSTGAGGGEAAPGTVGGAPGTGAGSGSGGQPPQTGFSVTLTDDQRKAIAEGKPLVLTDEQYTGGVRAQLNTERTRARTAEGQLEKIAKEREEQERKALEEQEKYKELYEREKADREKVSAQRATDLVRADFKLAALKAGIIDPDAAFLLAKSSPTFAETVKVADNGTVTGITEILKSLMESKPYLVAQSAPVPKPVGGPSNPGPTGGGPEPKNATEAGEALSVWAKAQG